MERDEVRDEPEQRTSQMDVRVPPQEHHSHLPSRLAHEVEPPSEDSRMWKEDTRGGERRMGARNVNSS